MTETPVSGFAMQRFEQSTYAGTVQQLVDEKVASRLFEKDATLWGMLAEPEARQRLNWVNPFPAAAALLAQAAQLREQLHEENISRVVLCGMGGSSLGPEVLARWAEVPLTLLDSTHPAVVKRVLGEDLEKTVVVVSSKSGSTVETRSHLACFEAAFAAAGIHAAERIVVVTDPNSALAEYANQQGYHVFFADPHVGGRFSVLTAFGIVPAVLAGVPMQQVMSDAAKVHSLCASDTPDNPAIQLASLITAALPERYVLPIHEIDGQEWGLADWIEQLVAESTGKDGVGVLPISLHPDAPEFTTQMPNALNVELTDGDTLRINETLNGVRIQGSLGAQFLLWETATALLGRTMNIDPFNQPDVESAKIAANAALAGATEGDSEVDHVGSREALLHSLASVITDSGYVAIHAYVDFTPSAAELLSELRDEIAQRLNRPVALGRGPRYLHSTGQLHKGGPATGVYVHILDDNLGDFAIPDYDAGFGALLKAQSGGDRSVLRSHNRPVYVLRMSDLMSPE